jgi:hypothetical protein
LDNRPECRIHAPRETSGLGAQSQLAFVVPKSKSIARS